MSFGLRAVLARPGKYLIGLLCAASFGLGGAATAVTPAEPDFLEAEQAFKMTARALNARTVELRFEVADGYYLYRDRIQVSAVLGAEALAQELKPQFPNALKKADPQFGDSQVYRGTLVLPVALDLQASASREFNVSVKAQGCADAGLCYPPFTRTASLTLPLQVAQITKANAPVNLPVDESTRIGQLLQTSTNTPLVLLSFLGFGLLLAFTPCVFPMLPILSSIVVGQGAGISKKRALVLSAAYVLGMAVTYTAAGVAAGLSGTLLSAAFQNPWVLGSFAVVFVVLALSMFGLYELQLPASLQTRLSASADAKKRGSLGGVVAMGALSALIVGPCVAAPLAGALLYIAQTGDALLGGAALFCMALGMGLPLLAVGVATRSVLPRAGAWMEAVKKGFGVMLLGVALWIVSPVLPMAATMLLLAVLLLFTGVFLHALDSLPHNANSWQRVGKGAGVLAVVTSLALLVGVLSGSRELLQPLAAVRAANAGSSVAAAANHQQGPRFETVRSLAELDVKVANANRPVMLDFYADWCTSCKEMEHLTFSDARVRARLAQLQLLQVDVTANTDADKALLKRFKLFGPPGIVLLEPGSARELQRVVGYQGADDFVQVLDRVIAR